MLDQHCFLQLRPCPWSRGCIFYRQIGPFLSYRQPFPPLFLWYASATRRTAAANRPISMGSVNVCSGTRPACAWGVMEDEHLPHDVIWKFAYGITLLPADELQHVQNCEQCSNACWQLNRDARRVNSDDPSLKKSA
jgi:hypothetical protein